MPSIGTEEEQSRKLFVGGISYDTDDKVLREYFCKYGNITDCVVIKDNETGKSKGFGFVTFELEQEADSCMSERPHNLKGRTIDVKRAVSREESNKPGAHVQVKKIFIGGVKEDIGDEALRAYFSNFGKILEFEVPVDRETQKPRGFAFITFDDFDTVDKLVAKRHHEICGHRCEVKKALSKQEMEKSKQQIEKKQQNRFQQGQYRHSPYGRGGRTGGRGGKMKGNYGGQDGYGGYGDYDDGYGGGFYGGGNYGPGPMRQGGYGGGYGGYGDRGGYDDGYGGYGGYGGGYGRY